MSSPMVRVILVFAMLVAASAAFAGSFTVGAQDDIFLSGGNSYTNDGGGVGNVPTATFPVIAGQAITFSGVTGSWSCCSGGSTFNGPDGGPFAGGSTDLSPIDGHIAGIRDTSHTMFLVGLFLGSSLPTVRPSRLDFSTTGLTESFTTLSPAPGQVFYIGDGLTGTGSGSTQTFIVPAGAVTLYLGVADGFDFTGLPGFYGDDVGSVSGTVSGSNPVPEPGSLILLGTGVLGLAEAIRRKLLL